ncbi:unnamed protein product [Arctia plantaginis]|uniref:Uncharacterized protein n=1 Tax=Arctia plantaginis TaxID=874455 RepID=A0A8S1AGQ0_ARCPL|nr:unnamed protein product [Arctia plantaginis]
MQELSIQCHSFKVCKYCGQPGHHSLLHNIEYNIKKKDSKVPENNSLMKPSTSKVANQTMSNHSTTTTNTPTTMLLATASVQAKTNDGTPPLLRVLCDQGSEVEI